MKTPLWAVQAGGTSSAETKVQGYDSLKCSWYHCSTHEATQFLSLYVQTFPQASCEQIIAVLLDPHHVLHRQLRLLP